MSIIASTSQSICFAPTNNSSSKMLFSFSKADRFDFNKKHQNENVSYDIPTSFSKRAPSLGYGDRSSFISKNNNPAPTSYQPKSDFDKVDPHGRAFSFGIAREAYEKVYIKENPPLDKNIPGPGSYSIPQKVGAEASKYSMKGRTLNHLMLTTTRHNPGPGAYEPKLSFDPQGKYFIARMKNSGATTFSLPSLPRFLNERKDQRPGPGSYNLKLGISDHAGSSQFLSTFQSPKTRTFYHSDRKTIEITKDTKNLPGPGNYKLPSDFGHYESKNKNDEMRRTLRASQSQPVL